MPRLPALLLPALLLAACALAGPAAPASGQTLQAVRDSGRLECATVSGADDSNGEDIHGNLSALGGEVCRAVAVAILGSADGLTVHAFPGEPEALAAVRSGVVQLVVGISPSASTAARLGLDFGPPVFWDSQRVMVSRRSGIADLSGLRDQLICAMDLTPAERTLRDEMTARDIPYGLMSHSEQGEMDAAVAVGRCVAGTATETRLAQSRANFHALVADFVFLPGRWAPNPVVPAWRRGDQAFGLVVDWTISALVEAEALGVTQENVAEAKGREDMRAERLLGRDFAVAQALGLAHDWAAKVVAAVGNYGEVFERTTGGPYRLERGLNALWSDGGLMAPLPMQ